MNGKPCRYYPDGINECGKDSVVRVHYRNGSQSEDLNFCKEHWGKVHNSVMVIAAFDIVYHRKIQ